jgi:hypothetical protein
MEELRKHKAATDFDVDKVPPGEVLLLAADMLEKMGAHGFFVNPM